MMSAEYYGITTPTDDFIAHYGIMGMKWGVRKAIKLGNSQKLGRQYAKAQKKLAKLEKRAANASKYGKRAAALGAGAAVAGGLAAAGTEGVGTAMRKVGGFAGRTMSNVGSAMMKSKNGKIRKAGLSINSVGNKANGKIVKAGFGVQEWGKSNSIGKAAGSELYKAAGRSSDLNKRLIKTTGTNIAGYEQKLGRVSNDTIARVGAGLVGVGLAAGAARNAYKAATAKKKAEKFRSEMNKAFAGTKYANGAGQFKPKNGKKRRR